MDNVPEDRELIDKTIILRASQLNLDEEER